MVLHAPPKNISWALIQTKLVNKHLSGIIATDSHVKLDSFLEFQQILCLKFQTIKCINPETFLIKYAQFIIIIIIKKLILE